jgi:hypothetical protein
MEGSREEMQDEEERAQERSVLVVDHARWEQLRVALEVRGEPVEALVELFRNQDL